MSIFQNVYDWIKNIKTPNWLRALLQEIQDILVATILSIGKEYLDQITAKILEVNGQNIPPEMKFKIVFNFSKNLLPQAKDSVLNALINLLVLRMKEQV